MDWIIFSLVVIWLGIVSWFDVRKSVIPHSAWVVIPMIASGFFRIWQRGWVLVLLTVFVVVVSERERISNLLQMAELGRMITYLPLLFLGLFFAVQLSPITALAIVGFWIAWELKWWGGADATAAISICLVWPGWIFILAFLFSHLILVMSMAVFSLIREEKIRLHRLPGLPILLASVFIFRIGLFLSG